MARPGQRPIVNPAVPPPLAFVVHHPVLVQFASLLAASSLTALLYRPGLAQVVVGAAVYVVVNAAMDRLQGLPYRIPDDADAAYGATLSHLASYRRLLHTKLRAAPRRDRRRLRSAADVAVWSVAQEVLRVGRIDANLAAELHAPWAAFCRSATGVGPTAARLADELDGSDVEVAASTAAALEVDEALVLRYVVLCRSGDFAPNPNLTYY